MFKWIIGAIFIAGLVAIYSHNNSSAKRAEETLQNIVLDLAREDIDSFALRISGDASISREEMEGFMTAVSKYAKAYLRDPNQCSLETHSGLRAILIARIGMPDDNIAPSLNEPLPARALDIGCRADIPDGIGIKPSIVFCSTDASSVCGVLMYRLQE
ncbi:MAG: hypothetical protein AAFR02_00090 [Pseudomonadota bacterium]